MQRIILISTILYCARALTLADKMLDLLTFPGAHHYFRGDLQTLHSRISAESYSVNPYDQYNYQTDSDYYINKSVHLIAPLTNLTLPISGLHRSMQPLRVGCIFGASNKIDQGFTISGMTYPLAYCVPPFYQVTNVTYDAMRLLFAFADLNSTGDFLRINTKTMGMLNVSCSASPTPLGHQDADRTFYGYNKQLYCYLDTPAGMQYMGPLPANLTEITLFRTGQIYTNGFHLGTIPSELTYVYLDKLAFQNKTVCMMANLTDTLITLNHTVIQQVTYCEKDAVQALACQQSTHQLQDGFYSDPAPAVNNLPKTLVTLPKIAESSTLQINVSATYSYGSASGSIKLSYNGSSNNSHCVQTPYFKLEQNLVCSGGCSVRIETLTCPFDLNAVSNGMSFQQFCVSTVSGQCSMQAIVNTGQPWGYVTSTLYVTYVEGQSFTGTSSDQIEDLTVLHLDQCTSYTIYGVSGTGVITLSDLQLPHGITFRAANGELSAFKNTTTGDVYTIQPCSLPAQLAIIDSTIVGAITSTNESYGFSNTIVTPTFYYSTNATSNCTAPKISYGELGVCADGSIGAVSQLQDSKPSIVPLYTGEIEIPASFKLSVQTEYLQVQTEQVVIDCPKYVCNGNPRCLQLLAQYTSACSNIESALHSSAQLDSREITMMFQTSSQSVELANITNFQGDYNFSMILPTLPGKDRSAIEDLLFDKVVTNGLGTVDQDYKSCSKGIAVADLVCAQYYNGIMVLPGVVDAEKMAMYTGSLTGAMVFGGLTAAAAIPFSTAVQARLNYVALQTNVLQENQKILAESFNQAVGNISLALSNVNTAIQQTSEALLTVSNAINKIQTVVNQQGEALAHLTAQLSQNFQAISTSIQDIYNRLDQIQADQQVDRLITGRLAALNAYVTQLLNKLSQVRQSRILAEQKINECVKSQSSRYGFCGNGTHLFSLTQAAPNGIFFMHAVLVPQTFQPVVAYAGICVDGYGYSLQPQLVLYNLNDSYRITPRNMFEPRTPTQSVFIPLTTCSVDFVNVTANNVSIIIPDYVDVNKTVSDIINGLPNYSYPELSLDRFNHTILNLSQEIEDLQIRSQNLSATAELLQQYIDNLNNTLVDLEWLNRVETYLKWPWYIWLLIFLAIAAFATILVTIFLCTGCCGGCFGCCGGCFGLFSKKRRLSSEPTPVSFKLKEW
ncbi:spike glycoprotein [White-eye coronavirus HKU16]|uniref:Spike glycoprotein n=1 Tax=White-eye coronavirus HKU16 TaxID=1159907 RepID=H9BQZ2_9NIDO|nr:spike glycoprotein [White-eye coronavirus HKU16]AFD29201.1 spike glycoprotein [White-eye coronavirus HKU16]